MRAHVPFPSRAHVQVDAFRQKAISLADVEQLQHSLVTGVPRELKRMHTLQPRRLKGWASVNLKDVRAISLPTEATNSPQKKQGGCGGCMHGVGACGDLWVHVPRREQGRGM